MIHAVKNAKRARALPQEHRCRSDTLRSDEA
jgi:hypothetical protein